MPTRSSRDYHFGEASITMSFNTEKPSTYMDPNLLTILEDIRAQLNNLGQRMDRIENDRRDGDCQSSLRREDSL